MVMKMDELHCFIEFVPTPLTEKRSQNLDFSMRTLILSIRASQKVTLLVSFKHLHIVLLEHYYTILHSYCSTCLTKKLPPNFTVYFAI